MSQQGPQPPVKEYRSGPVSGAIWRNETDKDGRTVVQHSVRVRKRYWDRATGEWRDSDYLFPDDIPRLRLVLAKCYEFIVLQDSEDDSDPPTIAA
jgi:hypothetical protein